MDRFILSGVLIAALACVLPAGRAMAEESSVNADRWVEIDLYWFDRGDIQGSAQRFWDRVGPLYTSVNGWRGLILNIGWTVDYVMSWSGDPAQHIPMVRGAQHEPWFKVGGQLTGTTEERQQKWKERFSKPANELRKDYEPWTYAEVADLARCLRTVAANGGVRDFRVGSFVLGFTGIYGGVSPWYERHPEFWKHADHGGVDFAAPLQADNRPLGGWPTGFPQDTVFATVFARQWGSLSRAIGMDALVLRDCMFVPTAYTRIGPYGWIVPTPEKAAHLAEATARLVRESKQANPTALVIGYSGGCSAVGEYRASGVDLEAIAREGYLDAWIDQTWAGAWNEVGVRAGTFWNEPKLGWTYQAAFMLVHAAQLAGTKVRHYQLVETFDAWESWDVIHTAPDRLRWGIWAYSHSAVKTPTGLRVPAGAYISWANQGTRLLEQQDVAFLKSEIDAAERDAHIMKEVHGATLVYNRAALEHQQTTNSGEGLKEWIDEQFGAVMKWSVPLSSITRVEWLDRVSADLLVVQTPVSLNPEIEGRLERLIRGGQPVMLVGSPGSSIDPDLDRLAGLEGLGGPRKSHVLTGELAPDAGSLAAGLPTSFGLKQWSEHSRPAPGSTVVYTVDGSPVLTLGTGHSACWDPPENEMGGNMPLTQLLGGSTAAYVLAARVATRLLASTDAVRAADIEAGQPVALAAWTDETGVRRILAGNLEEGISDGADLSRHVGVRLPAEWKITGPPGQRWANAEVTLANGVLEIRLPQAESSLIELRRIEK